MLNSITEKTTRKVAHKGTGDRKPIVVTSLAAARARAKAATVIPIQPPAEYLAAGATTLRLREATVAQREAETLRSMEPYASTDMVRGYLLGVYATKAWLEAKTGRQCD